MIFSFKKEHTFAKRKAESDRVRQKYPGRIPVICEKADKSDIVTLDKKKYLVPNDLTIGQFMYVIRKRVKLNPNKAIFVFIGGRLSSVVSLMSSVDEQFQDEDGFLYMIYSGESTFG